MMSRFRLALSPTLFLTGFLGTLLIVLLAGCGASEPGSETASEEPSAAAGSATESTPSTSEGSSPGDTLFIEANGDWNVHFTHAAGAGGELRFPEMMGGGVAVFDADGDGDLDLFFVSGASSNRFYRQGEDGRFTDATAAAGLEDAGDGKSKTGYATGVAVGDFDNDGRDDLFVSQIGPDRLWRNRGDGTFEDVTSAAGLRFSKDANREWSTSAVFCDLDRDDHLDLYVVGYVVYDPAVECTDKAGRPEYCGPDSFPDHSDTYWRNRGDGTFENATASAGFGAATGAGLGVVCEDLDDDGFMDLYVANDGDPNQLWVNQGDGTFLDDALILGASVNAAGLHEAGMGVVASDFDGDLDFDLFLTHLRDETNTFYRNLGAGVGFEDQTTRLGLAAESTPYTGFGTAPLDVDLDGDLDLVVANGRVTRGEPLTSDLPGPWNAYAEPNLVYRNDGGEFVVMGDSVRAVAGAIEVSRGLATGDLDDDGDLDLVVTNIESPSRLYRAEAPAGHWLRVDALDPRLGGRRALGARVTVQAGGGEQVRTVQGASSYLSSSDPRAHFGFPASVERVEQIRVRWPDGLEESFASGDLDRTIVLRRGEGSS